MGYIFFTIGIISLVAFWGYSDGLKEREKRGMDVDGQRLKGINFSIEDIFPSKEKIRGDKGESIIRSEIVRLNKKEYVSLHDILLPYKERTTQIDHIIFSVYGVFCIENKNMKGLIFGNEKNQKWKQVLYKRKEEFLNPIIQNKVHINAISNFIFEILEREEIHNFVVFSDEAKLKVTSTEPVLNYSELKRYLKQYRVKVFTKEEVIAMCAIIMNNNIVGKEARKNHVKMLRERMTVRTEDIERDTCPNCQGKLVDRVGTYGVFKGCENYPRCKFTSK